MGIRFYCPNGCKVHVKAFQAGRRGICPHCGTGVDIPLKSTRPPSREKSGGKATTGGLDVSELPSLGEADAGAGNDEETELLPDASRELAGGRAGAAPLPGDSPRWDVAGGGEASGMASATVRSEAPPPLPPLVGASSDGAIASEPPPLVAGGAFPGVGPASAPDGAPNRSAAMPGPPVGEMSTVGTDSGGPRGASPTEPDVLQDAPDVIWYIRPPSGGQYGPANRDVMRAWLAEGRITPDSLVWREGWRDWKEALAVFPEGVFPQLRVPDAIPGLDRMFDEADTPPPVGFHAGPVRRGSPVRRILAVLLFLAVAGGVLAAIYFVVRGRWL